MSRLTRLAATGLTLVVSLGCAAGAYGPSIETPVTQPPRDIDELTVDERRAMLDRAEVFRRVDTARLNLLAGPPGKQSFPFDASVTCEFSYPDEPLSGVTPKFECDLGDDDVVKVKYGANNGEVFAEVAATRLFWALGFVVDQMFPVSVTCVNCPADPHKASTAEWRLGKPGNVATRRYDPAVIERKFEGRAIEVPKFEGWSWRELEAVADNDVGATRAQIDALKLLAAFVQHVDSKPANQALVCAGEAVGHDRQGNATCSRPYLIVKDLGSSFAAAGKITFPKMKLESWRDVKVWKDEKSCQANLTSSFVGTLEHPRISESGRRFLAERLTLLTDAQLLDLFTAARVERRQDTVNGRPVTAADWVLVFKAKRDQIVNHRCQT
jgi:hypothetical protein